MKNRRHPVRSEGSPTAFAMDDDGEILHFVQNDDAGLRAGIPACSWMQAVDIGYRAATIDGSVPRGNADS